ARGLPAPPWLPARSAPSVPGSGPAAHPRPGCTTTRGRASSGETGGERRAAAAAAVVIFHAAAATSMDRPKRPLRANLRDNRERRGVAENGRLSPAAQNREQP